MDCSALDYSNQPYKVEKKIWNYNISAQDGAVIIEKIVKTYKTRTEKKITEELLQHEKLIISFKEKKSVIINEINSRKRKKYSLKRFVPRRVCMPDQLKLTEIYNTANPLWKVPDGYIFPSNLRYFIQEMLLLMEYPNLTLLASGGCPRLLSYILDNPTATTNLNVEATNPAGILGISKKKFKLIKQKDWHSIYILDAIKLEKKYPDTPILTTIKENIFWLYFLDYLEFLIEQGYNPHRLTRYVQNIAENKEIKHSIEAVVLLRDYVEMSIFLGETFERYPKSLKKSHDLVMIRYRIKEDEIINRKVHEVCNSLKELKYRDDKFLIKAPKGPEDIAEEGRQLSHCVGSYLPRIANGKSKIIFMRRRECPDEPFLTIEIMGKQIVQKKKKYNQLPNKEENNFIKKWAAKVDLNVL